MAQPAETSSQHDEPFQLGLVLAGAISAGAYTAGVIDFLVQALTEWEKHRGEPGVPDHRVVIKVIAGASAGAITGALGAVALARGLDPRPFDPPPADDDKQPLQCVLPSLYRTWVELPRMTGPQGGLLDTGDLDALRGQYEPVVKSLLDATVLDRIKLSALEPDGNSTKAQPPLPFVARRLHLYMTVSNMRGIPFKVAFDRSSYGMQTIGDRIHYVVEGLGSHDVSVKGSWAEKDAEEAAFTVSVDTLPERRTGRLPDTWDRFGTIALASGAFPVGLAPRHLELPWKHYTTRRHPLPLVSHDVIRPAFPEGYEAAGSFVFETVDGGLVNNNPFDYAQYALTGDHARPTNGTEARNAIVMVAPFPEPPPFPPEGSPSPAITAIVRALFPALVTQARFRASELAPAVDERDFSRFLVSPLRRPPRPAGVSEDPPLERYAIGCGLLGGFGGFLDEGFRDHDFQLGRRNCQQFLRSAFQVAADNPVVRGIPQDKFKSVIPLVGTAALEVPYPAWRQMSAQDFEHLCRRVEHRVSRLLPLLVRAQTLSQFLRLALWLGWQLFLKKRTLTFIRLTMLADLVRRSQVAGYGAPAPIADWATEQGRRADDVQAVIAELVVPAFDYRTPGRIATVTQLPVTFVEALLDRLSADDVPEAVRVCRDPEGDTLAWRRPGLLRRLPPFSLLLRWWNRPKTD